jgi:hypothetical protein
MFQKRMLFKHTAMKRLSLWAYHHKWSARLLIVVCYLVLNTAGFLIGDLLGLMGVHVSSGLVYLFSAAALSGCIFYPSSREKQRCRNYYLRQKTCDALLITTTLLLIISAANLRQEAHTPFHLSTAGAVVPVSPHPSGVAGNVKPAKKSSFLKDVKTALTQAFHKVRSYYKRLNTTDKIVLTAVLALLAAAALYGVVAWACSLSCSGPEAVGWIVLVGGTGVIVFLVLWAGRTINRVYRRRKESRANTTGR